MEITTTRGSGPGGQNRNKVETCVVVKHKPSGLTVRAESERSQHQNKLTALKILAARLAEARASEDHEDLNGQRRQMLGSGMRGDKRRTIRTQDGVVKDHVTGRRWRYADYIAGKW